MKQRSTLERRRERREFLYLHRKKFTELLEASKKVKCWRKVQGARAFVDMTVRPGLNYSKTLWWTDILIMLQIDYKHLVNEGIIVPS